MSITTSSNNKQRFLPDGLAEKMRARFIQTMGFILIIIGIAYMLALISYDARDPSFNNAALKGDSVHNLLHVFGAYLADLFLQSLGLVAYFIGFIMCFWGWRLMKERRLPSPYLRLALLPVTLLLLAMAFTAIPPSPRFPVASGFGGSLGLVGLLNLSKEAIDYISLSWIVFILSAIGFVAFIFQMAIPWREWRVLFTYMAKIAIGGANILTRQGQGGLANLSKNIRASDGKFSLRAILSNLKNKNISYAPSTVEDENNDIDILDNPSKKVKRKGKAARNIADGDDEQTPPSIVHAEKKKIKESKRATKERQYDLTLENNEDEGFQLPPLSLLANPPEGDKKTAVPESALEQNARMLEEVLQDFGVKGAINDVNPGPVVTLYELDPAPGTKTSRVIGLSDDIARSMSAISVRIATVPGRNVIGIEMPNQQRLSVYLRELLSSSNFENNKGKLPIILGKDIGGAPEIADLATMPHLLIAGTTGSGKSVGLNAMILSLLYKFTPEQCKFIMIDPKMLELSVYDDIPHLLSPVVTDPKKAVVALKWAVREMENRYRAMSHLSVRNIDGYNKRVKQALASGDIPTRKVQVGFDNETGLPIYEEQELSIQEFPYIVVVVDEMADLMLVAGKEIEASIQRLAQMARAAGIHIVMATQRPSVDVITGTIKANFPTRISFMVTSKIDSRTILGEQGAEQLLGRGDMLYMAGGGRITRVHGPFVDDKEVEDICNFLKSQGSPDYIDAITIDEDEENAINEMLGGDTAIGGNSGDELYDRAVAIVAREGKASTSFIQRHLQIGYNRAATIIEKMEKEGVVSAANHVGKREVLIGDHS